MGFDTMEINLVKNLALLKINGLPGLQGLRTYYLAVYVDIGHLVHQVCFCR